MRYLFLDDHHIEFTRGLTRYMHQPVKDPKPVLASTEPWEENRINLWNAPCYDHAAGCWRMYYHGGAELRPLLAVSPDGVNWEKPELRLKEFEGSRRNNIVDIGFPAKKKENRFLFVYDASADVPYKGVTRVKQRMRPITSRDGLVWVLTDVEGPPSHDEYRFGRDAIHGRYLVTVKQDASRSGGYHGASPVPEYGRSVALSLSEDLTTWSEPELIFAADERDRAMVGERIAASAGKGGPIYIDHPEEYDAQVYNMAVFTYEDMYLALPTFFNVSGTAFSPKKSFICDNGVLYPQLTWSRDLRHWALSDAREMFLPLSPPDSGRMDRGMIQSTVPVRRDGELWFYYMGTRTGHASLLLDTLPGHTEVGEYAGPASAFFIARMREDGFASLDAGDVPGVLLTKVLTVDGDKLLINADASRGEIRAEVRDAETGRAIPGYSLGERYPGRFSAVERERMAESIAAAPDTSLPVVGDGLGLEVRWRGSDFASLRGRSVRIYFHLRNASLYGFRLV